MMKKLVAFFIVFFNFNISNQKIFADLPFSEKTKRTERFLQSIPDQPNLDKQRAAHTIIAKNSLFLSSIPLNLESLKKLCQLTWLTKITLSSTKIDVLPDEISRLTELKKLKLPKNNLSVLPDSFTQLENLKELSLYGNAFSEFPILLTEMTGLEKLTLSNNQVKTIPKQIRKLNHLRILKLNHNLLNVIPSAICNLKELKIFDLSHNFLKHVPKNFEFLQNIVLLNLLSNPLQHHSNDTELGSLELVKMFKEKVELFSFSEKQETTEDFIDIIENIVTKNEKEKIKRDILYRSTLSLNTSDALQRVIQAIPTLFWLEKIEFQGFPLERLPQEICELPFLEELSLIQTGTLIFPEGLNSLKNLKTVRLISNNLAELPSFILELQTLESLNLNDNLITCLPRKIKYLQNLKTIDLVGNPLALRNNKHYLGRNGLESIWQNQFFFFLDRKRQELVETFLTSFPLEFVNMHGAKLAKSILFESRLSLIDIPLFDYLLEEILNFTWLKELVLINNQIDKIPYQIAHLDELEKLVITRNNLKFLPNNIGELRNLKELDLSQNFLEKIPLSVGNLTELRILNLHTNELKYLPKSIYDLPKLEELNLTKNKFKNFPEDILKLRDHTDLKLFGNPLYYLGKGTRLGLLEIREFFQSHLDIKNYSFPRNRSFTYEKLYELLDQKALKVNRETVKSLKLPEIPVTDLNAEQFLNLFEEIVQELNFTDENEADYLSYEILDQAKNRENEPNQDIVERKIIAKLRGFLKSLWGIEPLVTEKFDWKYYEEQKDDLQNALAHIFKKLKLADPETRSMLFIVLTHGLLHCQTGQKEGVDSVILSLEYDTVTSSINFDTRLILLLALKKNEAFKKAITPGRNAQNVHILSYYGELLREEIGLSSAFKDYKEKIGRIGFDPFRENSALALQAFYVKFLPHHLIQTLLENAENQHDHDLQMRLYSIEDKIHAKHKKENLGKQIDQYKQIVEQSQNKQIIEMLTKQIEALEKQLLESKKSDNQEIESIDESEIPLIKGELSHIHKFQRRFKIHEIVSYLIDEKLLVYGQNGLEGWENFFTSDPSNTEVHADLTYDGAKNILIHMKLINVN